MNFKRYEIIKADSLEKRLAFNNRIVTERLECLGCRLLSGADMLEAGLQPYSCYALFYKNPFGGKITVLL